MPNDFHFTNHKTKSIWHEMTFIKKSFSLFRHDLRGRGGQPEIADDKHVKFQPHSFKTAD